MVDFQLTAIFKPKGQRKVLRLWLGINSSKKNKHVNWL